MEPSNNHSLPELPFDASHAFIIGINSYRDASISPLKTAVNDAKKIAEVFEKHGYNMHPPLLDATREEIDRLLESMAASVGENDRVFFYYAGHGIAAENKVGRPDGYLIPSDALHSDLPGTAVSMSSLYAALDRLPCRHLLLVLDCCFAGAFRWTSKTRDLMSLAPKKLYREHFDRFVHEPAWQVITSAAYDQKALDVLDGKPTGDRGESGDNVAHSPFARFLIEGIAGDADVRYGQEGDGVITATELYIYLRDKLEPASIELGEKQRQTPSFFPLPRHDKGEYIFLNLKNRRNLPRIARINPYKGLQSFNEEDQDLFYGRDRVIADLRKRAAKNPFLAVVGPSGTGKSSVIKAGLFPVLRGDGYQLLPVVRPGTDPIGSFEKALKAAGMLGPRSSLRNGVPKPVLEKVRQEKLVLLIDQFEELITQCSIKSRREAFKSRLHELITGTPDDAFRVIITARADFEPQLLRGPLAEMWQKGRCTVPPFSVEELREAIIRPSAQQAFIFDPPELVDEIIEDVVQSPGALPLLSYTLSEMYNVYVKDSTGEHRAMKREYYEQLGGVMGALHNKADRLYNSLKTEREKLTMRKVMLRMVSLEGEVAGRRVLLRDLRYPGRGETARLKKIIDALEVERLIVRGKNYIEPAHDALVRAWVTLHEWIDDEGKNWLRLLDTVKEATKEYREVRTLWEDDPRLDTLIPELENEKTLLNKAELEFLSKSRDLREKKRNRRTYTIAGVMTSLSILAVIAVIFAISATREKKNVENLKYYDENFSSAKQLEEKAGRALDSPDFGEVQKAYLYTLAALGQDLAPDKKLPVSQGRLSSRGLAAGVFQQIWSSPGAFEPVTAVAASPDGRLLALASRDGWVRLAEIATGTELRALDGHRAAVTAVAFSPDGRFFASAAEDSTVLLRKVSYDSLHITVQAPVIATLTGHRAAVKSVAFGPNGETLASVGADSSLLLWDLREPGFFAALFGGGSSHYKIRRRQRLPAPPTAPVAFTPTGRALVCGTASGHMLLWDGSGKKRRASIQASQTAITALAPLPGDSLLVAADAAGTVQIFRIRNRSIEPLERAATTGGAIAAIAVDPAGHVFATGSSDGTLRLWQSGTIAVLAERSAHEGAVGGLAFVEFGARPETAQGQPGSILISAGEDRRLAYRDGRSGALLAATAGHRSSATSVAFSPGDSILASAAEDGTILLWEVTTGRQMRALRGHSGRVTQLIFAGKAGDLLSSSLDGSVRLWRADAREGGIVLQQKAGIQAIATNADATLIFSGGDDGTVRRWMTGEGAGARLVTLPAGIQSLALAPDGRRLAIGDVAGMLYLWDLVAGEELARWQAHERATKTLAFDNSGEWLASGSEDDQVRVWNTVPDGQLMQFLRQQQGPVYAFSQVDAGQYMLTSSTIEQLRRERVPDSILARLRFLHNRPFSDKANLDAQLDFTLGSPEQRRYRPLILQRAYKREMLSAYQPGARDTVRLDPNRSLHVLRGHDDDVQCVAFSSDGRFLASGSSDETIRLWDLRSWSELARLQGHRGPVLDVSFSQAAENKRPLLASAGEDQTARLWDLRESTNLDTVLDNCDIVRDLAFSPRGTILASASEDHHVRLWKIRRGHADSLADIQGSWAVTLSVAFSPVDSIVAYGAKDDNVRLWNVRTGRFVTLPGQRGDALSVAFSANGAYLAAGSSDGHVRIWNVHTRKLLEDLRAHTDKVRAVVFHPSDTLLATAGSDKRVHLWRLETGRVTEPPFLTYDRHKNGVWGLAFSHNGALLATASWDNTVQLHNLRTGRMRRLVGHRGPVLAVAFSPDDAWLASASWDQSVRVWDVLSGRQLDILHLHSAPVTAVAFHPDGKLLASGSRDRRIRLRDLSYLEPIAWDDRSKLDQLINTARDTSARLRDLIFLMTAETYQQRDSLALPFKSVFEAYAHRFSYHLTEELELVEEPAKFSLQPVRESAFFLRPFPHAMLRRPRPEAYGPLSWVIAQLDRRLLYPRRGVAAE